MVPAPLVPVTTVPELRTMAPEEPVAVDAPLLVGERGSARCGGGGDAGSREANTRVGARRLATQDCGWHGGEAERGSEQHPTHLCSVDAPLTAVGEEPALRMMDPVPACAAYPVAMKMEPETPLEVVPLLRMTLPLVAAVAALALRTITKLCVCV
jgi:hypothetical protein